MQTQTHVTETTSTVTLDIWWFPPPKWPVLCRVGH